MRSLDERACSLRVKSIDVNKGSSIGFLPNVGSRHDFAFLGH